MSQKSRLLYRHIVATINNFVPAFILCYIARHYASPTYGQGHSLWRIWRRKELTLSSIRHQHLHQQSMYCWSNLNCPQIGYNISSPSFSFAIGCAFFTRYCLFWQSGPSSTIGLDHFAKEYQFGRGDAIILDLWDTGGELRGKSLLKQ